MTLWEIVAVPCLYSRSKLGLRHAGAGRAIKAAKKKRLWKTRSSGR